MIASKHLDHGLLYTSFPDISLNLFDNFPILALLSRLQPRPPGATPPSVATPLLGLSAVVISLPGILLKSAKSHVLDEPAPKLSRADTLPWDCCLSNFSGFTVIGGRVEGVVERVMVKTSIATQQEGLGVTVHTDTVTLSVSQRQVSCKAGIRVRVEARARARPRARAGIGA